MNIKKIIKNCCIFICFVLYPVFSYSLNIEDIFYIKNLKNFEVNKLNNCKNLKKFKLPKNIKFPIYKKFINSDKIYSKYSLEEMIFPYFIFK